MEMKLDGSPRSRIEQTLEVSIMSAEVHPNKVPTGFNHDEYTDDSDSNFERCCEHPEIQNESGEWVCRNCGLVHGPVLQRQARRAFTMEEVRTRRDHEPVISPIGPRTMVDGHSSDAFGQPLTPSTRTRFNRLGKIHRSLTSSYERNLWLALPRLSSIAENFHLSVTCIEDAERIYKRAVKEKLTMGRSINAIVVASIYAAMRLHDVPLTLDEIVEQSGQAKKSVVRAYRLILMNIVPLLGIRVSPMKAKSYLRRFVSELGLQPSLASSSESLVEELNRLGLQVEGKDPKGLAAALIYVAARKIGIHKTQTEIARIAKITEVTLRTRTKEILALLEKKGEEDIL